MKKVHFSLRFWDKVDKQGPEGCWVFTGSRNSDGYGSFNARPTTDRAHRAAWILTYGEIPESMSVLHRCDNPPCCNPNHLFLGTHLDNVRDRHLKGRSRGPRPGENVATKHPEYFRGERNGRAKVNWGIVSAIREAYGTGKYRQVDLAKRYGLVQTQVSRIIRNEHWKGMV